MTTENQSIRDRRNHLTWLITSVIKTINDSRQDQFSPLKLKGSAMVKETGGFGQHYEVGSNHLGNSNSSADIEYQLTITDADVVIVEASLQVPAREVTTTEQLYVVHNKIYALAIEKLLRTAIEAHQPVRAAAAEKPVQNKSVYQEIVEESEKRNELREQAEINKIARAVVDHLKAEAIQVDIQKNREAVLQPQPKPERHFFVAASMNKCGKTMLTSACLTTNTGLPPKFDTIKAFFERENPGVKYEGLISFSEVSKQDKDFMENNP